MDPLSRRLWLKLEVPQAARDGLQGRAARDIGQAASDSRLLTFDSTSKGIDIYVSIEFDRDGGVSNSVLGQHSGNVGDSLLTPYNKAF